MRTVGFRLAGRTFLLCHCRSALQARFLLDAGSRARRRGTFLCSAKEKYPKERRPEGAARYLIYKAASQPCPCASRENRRMRNSRISLCEIHSNKRMLHPVFTAMLGCAYGRGRSTPCREPLNPVLTALLDCDYGGFDLPPVALTEYRSQSGE